MNNPVDQPKVSDLDATAGEAAWTACLLACVRSESITRKAFDAGLRAYLATLPQPTVRALTFEQKTAINIEFQRLYDEGMRTGEHGHYETMFGAMHALLAQGLQALALPTNQTGSAQPLYAAPTSERVQALTDVAAERERQKSVEGWTPEHDDGHVDSELARAASAYAVYAASPKRFTALYRAMMSFIPSLWPWAAEWWKPSPDNRRNLVKAGALILAEIERLDRAALLHEGQG